MESIVAASLIGTMPLFTYIIAYFISKNKSLDFISITGLLLGFLTGLVVAKIREEISGKIFDIFQVNEILKLSLIHI